MCFHGDEWLQPLPYMLGQRYEWKGSLQAHTHTHQKGKKVTSDSMGTDLVGSQSRDCYIAEVLCVFQSLYKVLLLCYNTSFLLKVRAERLIAFNLKKTNIFFSQDNNYIRKL